MEATKSLEIIERMLTENKKSLHRNSFYFILWGTLLIPAGLWEYFMRGTAYFYLVWPAVGILGGFISMIYGAKESKRIGVKTAGDRITNYTWGAFGFTMVFGMVYTVYNGLTPHAFILIVAGMATFISGGVSRFKPFVVGGIMLALGAIVCAFVVAPVYHSLVFSASLLLGYVIPGILLRKSENV
jgi:hypothetical protein